MGEPLKILEQEPMSRHTTFRIGGPAEYMAFPTSEAQAAESVRWAERRGLPWRCIGGGSNLLVRDEGLLGLTILLTGLDALEAEGTRLRAGAGVPLGKLAVFHAKQALSGLAFAYGIPGTAGGAVVMNAGAYGGEVSQVLYESRCLAPDGTVVTLPAGAHDFGYRHSVFAERPDFILLSAEFALREGEPAAVLSEMEALMAKRRAKQPLELPSAGSVFKRPPGQYAGELIERCGLKGHTVGGAKVSEKHAGFIVNVGGATCRDVLALIEHIQNVVLQQTGFALELELRVL
jgi:UDP-N-acetylmuramate dehydrogenase